MKYKEIGTEMKKGKISSILGLLFASSFLIRTVIIHQMRASKKQESEKIAAVQKFIKSQEQAESEKQKGFYTDILRNGSGTSEPGPSYDKTIFVNQQYNIGVRDGAYYLVTISSKKELLLEGVDNAYALAVRNEDKNKQEVAMVVHKDGAWHVINEEGEITKTLDRQYITAHTKLVVKNQTLDFE